MKNGYAMVRRLKLTMRKPTRYLITQTEVAERLQVRLRNTPQILLFLQQSRPAQVIPSKDGALQAVLQVHRIAQVEHSPPMQTQLCMRYGQRTNIPFPLTQTVVAVLPQVRPKLTVLILRCPQRNRQEADIHLQAGGRL